MINPRVIRRHEVSLGGFGMSAITLHEGVTLDASGAEVPTWGVQNCGLDPFGYDTLAEAAAAFDRLMALEWRRAA